MKTSENYPFNLQTTKDKYLNSTIQFEKRGKKELKSQTTKNIEKKTIKYETN